MTTDDELLQLFRDLEARYSMLREEFKKDDALIGGKFGDHIIPDDTEDAGLRVTEPPTINNAIENASDHILSTPRIIAPDRPVRSGRERAAEDALKRQRFLEFWWARVFVGDGDPLGRAKKELIKGKSVLKKEIDWRLFPAIPENPTPAERLRFRERLRKVASSKFLWHLRVVPKETVYEDLESPWDPQFVFEAYEVSAIEARRRWPHLAGSVADRAPLERVRYIEYWSKPQGADRGRYVQWIEDERVHESFNPYSWETPLHTEDEPDYDGYVPYAIADPGFGHVDAECNPHDRYASLIKPIRSVATAEARFLTEMEAYLRLYIWKPLLTSGYPPETVFRLGPGAHWEKDPETQNIELLQFGEMPISLLQGMERVNQYADEASKFGALGGTPQRGVDTALENDQHVRNAAAKLSGPLRANIRQVTQINAWVLMDIDKVLEAPVTIFGATDAGATDVTLSPDDIDGYYITQVEMETTEEAALSMRLARQFSDLYQRIPLTARTVLTKAGVDDPDGEIAGRMQEDLERSPQALQFMTMMMLAGLQQAAETREPAGVVAQAFQQSLTQPQGGGGQQQPRQQPAAPDAVEALRSQARDEAIEAQPERSLY